MLKNFLAYSCLTFRIYLFVRVKRFSNEEGMGAFTLYQTDIYVKCLRISVTYLQLSAVGFPLPVKYL